MIRFKHFHDSLNTAVILAPGCKFFSAEFAQFPLAFTEWNYTKDIFRPELLSFIFEINFIKR